VGLLPDREREGKRLNLCPIELREGKKKPQPLASEAVLGRSSAD
jgi:hypothetical protein